MLPIFAYRILYGNGCQDYSWVCFFSGDLSFSCGVSQLEKRHTVRRVWWAYKQCLWGGGGRAAGFFLHFVSTHLSLTVFSWSAITVPHPPGLHGQNCPIMQSHPPLPSHLVLSAAASHFQQACVGSYCCCLADKPEKQKRQNIVVVLISAKIQMLGGLSLPNHWTNK